LITSLDIQQLSVERGGRIVLASVDATIGAGEAVIVTGPNGVGKTTFLRTIAGYLPALSGSITLQGGNPALEISEQLHYIGHNNAIKLSLTVRENLSFWACFLDTEPAKHSDHGNRSEAAVACGLDVALDRFRLRELADLPAAYLSAGQKRRTALARLLVAPRPLWLLDEPTVALDQSSSAALTDIANRHLRSGGLILAATHFPLAFATSRELKLSWPGEIVPDSLLSDEATQ